MNNTVNSQPEVRIKNTMLPIIQRMQKAKELIVRPWTPIGQRYRILDEKVNPLATVTNSELNFLLSNKIIEEADHTNKYRFNEKIKIITA